MNTPDKIKTPFASGTGALKSTIPENGTVNDTEASMQMGFPPRTMSQETDRMPPTGEDMNGILYKVTDAVRFLQAGGTYPFDNNFCTAIGGYPKGAILTSVDGAKLFINSVAGNSTNPEVNGVGWLAMAPISGIDVDPMLGSTNAVESGGVYTALSGKVDIDDADDAEVTATGSSTARTLASRFADVVNVRDFGAKGDGVLSGGTYSGTDDTSAINTALQQAASEGKAVVFPTGAYLVTEVTIPDGVPVVDFNGSTIVRTKNNTNKSLIWDDTTGLTVRNLNVVAKNTSIYGNAVRGLRVKNLRLENISIVTESPQDSNQYGCWGLTLSGEDIRIQNIYINTSAVGLWGDGIHLGRVKNFEMTNFEIHSGDDAFSICQHAPMTGEWDERASENIVIGNGILSSRLYSDIKIDRYPTGYTEEQSNQHTVRDVLIHDVVFPAGHHNLIAITDYSGWMENAYDNIILDSCVINDDQTDVFGIIVDASAKTGFLSFQNCLFKRESGAGAYASIYNVSDFNLQGCAFNDSSSGSTDWYFVDCPSITLKGNRFKCASNGNHLVRVNGVNTVNCQDNLIINETAGSTQALRLENLTESSVVRLIGNAVIGSSNPVPVVSAPASIAELLSINNYWGGGDVSSLLSQGATIKVIGDSDSFVPVSRTVNSKALSSDITLTSSDVGAVAKTGDTMSASLAFSSNVSIRGTARDQAHSYLGSQAEGTCSVLYLRGDKYTSNQGAFDLHAKSKDDTTSVITDVYFRGAPNGTLTWNGQPLQTTSDARFKTPMQDVPDEVLDAWGDVDWGQFQFLSSVEEKGDTARLHTGLIAQRVDEVFKSHGLDACAYGILCHEDNPAEINEDGDEVVPAVEMWMVRYDEAQAMEAAYQRRRANRIEARLEALEERLGA